MDSRLFSRFARSHSASAVLAVLFAASAVFPAVAEEKPPVGYRFPAGDAEDGILAFQQLNCVQCHTVKDVVLEDPKGERRLELELASDMRFVKRYEDLITAIVNPRHVIQEQYRAILDQPELAGGIEPMMPSLAGDMSAQQLMDLVAFLHAVYSDSVEGYAKD
jgi:mono/diheme cytochrome c family protein